MNELLGLLYDTLRRHGALHTGITEERYIGKSRDASAFDALVAAGLASKGDINGAPVYIMDDAARSALTE